MTKTQIRNFLRLRRNRGLQKKIAAGCGISESLLSMWLSGDRNPKKIGFAECVQRMVREYRNAAH